MSTQPKIKPKATIWLNTKNSTWGDMGDVLVTCVGKPVRITGTTLDLNGCQISGTKLPKPKDDNDEGAAALRINIPGFTIKDGSIRGIPGGIIFRKDKFTAEKLIFLDIVEDGLSNIIDDSKDATIRGCEFWGASDKSLQLNDARGVTVEGNTFNGGVTAVRLQKKGGKYSKPKTKSLKHNRFIGCDTAWHLSGDVQCVGVGNVYSGVDKRVVKSDSSTFKGV